MRNIPLKILLAICIAFMAMAYPGHISAQIVNADSIGTVISSDSIRRAFDNGPYFGLYKDNYFIFGTSVGQRPTKENSI